MKKIMAFVLTLALVLAIPAFGFSGLGTDTVSGATIVSPALNPAVTSVTVSPAAATVTQGSTKQLTAAVVVVDGAAQTVSWTSTSSKVTVSGTGLVTVAADAPVAVYTLMAISTVDASKTGISTITVIAPVPVLTNLTAYNAALTAKVQTSFTTPSWTVYQTVVAANVVTTANTQAQVDAATLAIKTAQGSLVSAPVVTNPNDCDNIKDHHSSDQNDQDNDQNDQDNDQDKGDNSQKHHEQNNKGNHEDHNNGNHNDHGSDDGEQ